MSLFSIISTVCGTDLCFLCVLRPQPTSGWCDRLTSGPAGYATFRYPRSTRSTISIDPRLKVLKILHSCVFSDFPKRPFTNFIMKRNNDRPCRRIMIVWWFPPEYSMITSCPNPLVDATIDHYFHDIHPRNGRIRHRPMKRSYPNVSESRRLPDVFFSGSIPNASKSASLGGSPAP